MSCSLFTDGGARGNPGPAGLGALLFEEDKLIGLDGSHIKHATNNQAEYEALILGLKLAKKQGAKVLVCNLDSELVVKQLNGEYKVKNEEMKKMYQKVMKLSEDFEGIAFRHVPREENKFADKIVNLVLDAVN